MVRQARTATKRDLVLLLILRRGREKSTISSLFSCSIYSRPVPKPSPGVGRLTVLRLVQPAQVLFSLTARGVDQNLCAVPLHDIP